MAPRYRWNVGLDRYHVRIGSLPAAITRKEGRRMSNLDDRGPFRPGVVPGDAGDGARVEMGADRERAEYMAWLDRGAAAGREP
jgi:hypothetical protein